MKEYLAHVKKNNDNSWDTHLLKQHLKAVAKMTGNFASEFGNKDWGELLGVLHDLGKYLPAWQVYLRRNSGFDTEAHIEEINNRPTHSTAGAVFIYDKLKNHPIARLIAYGIAGHHTGLPDAEPPSAGNALSTRLFRNLLMPELNIDELQVIREITEVKEIIGVNLPKTVPLKMVNLEQQKEHMHLWVRMLYSCLVDSDFLDTEYFMDPDKNCLRGKSYSIALLKQKFDDFMMRKPSDSPINKVRNNILKECINKAALQPGLFSLNVPTGGGKTLSSMAFALNHAIKHNKKRIIIAIPYTSIIEQTAKVFKYGTDNDGEIEERRVCGEMLFGEDNVIEHHSNLEPDKETSNNRLAAENWDAPIIVTTNVQLFESLFACKSSQCRKLHNIVNSVVILDEVQMLPPEFLRPILSVLNGLVEYFGVTVVLMTATQPSITGRIGSDANTFNGLQNVTNIIENPNSLAKIFSRIEIELPDNLDIRMDWNTIASKLISYEQVLCIVNSRKDCRKLYALMPRGTFHLSAYMCGEHRSEIISEIKKRLRENAPIRVISTQLIEAGVDIDFPVVYRAMAGLDSIAQAAGRCNRENKLAALGKKGSFVVFNPPTASPIGLLRKGEDASKALFRSREVDVLTPELFAEYFKLYYSNINEFDKAHFYDHLVKEADEFKFQFRTFAQEFHLIEQDQKSIIVNYENSKTGFNSEKWIEQLRTLGPTRYVVRHLQRFTVTIPEQVFSNLLLNNCIEEINGFYVQAYSNIYDKNIGLLVDESDWKIGSGVV